jgi:protein-L-isoaspartate(D-aspartate) O-methyltransferase
MPHLRTFVLLICAAVGPLHAVPAAAQTKAEFEKLRKKLIEEVIKPGGVKNEGVLRAMSITERHEFVQIKDRDKAYFDMALPIGDKQTISAPFVVAYMTEAIDPQKNDKVLEIGTGSGYQAAVLSPLVREVYSIEIVKALGERAERTLKRLNYKNVFTKVGDGFQGWKEHAPFDKIIVTCSPEKVPQPLIDQLSDGGMMIIPVGERYQQTLYLYRKREGKLEAEPLKPILFVPMTGAAEAARTVKPDPLHPKLINGNFEEEPDKNGFPPGWYYHQQVQVVRDGSPEGKSHVKFANIEPGRSSHMLQGFPIDGTKIHNLELSGRMKISNVEGTDDPQDLPTIVVTFYDDNRRDLGTYGIGIGTFRGTFHWQKVSEKIRVPTTAREGIMRVGLFGAAGEAEFDDIRMTPLK